MLVDFGRANWLEKARQQPDRVKDVARKIATDGVAPTIHAVRSKLSQPISLGYANAGVVIGVGERVRDFAVGDRVASNGPHAEIVSVPRNLCARIPGSDDVIAFEEAAFTTIASIALQGVRLVAPTLGECTVVTGLGLIGLITVQLLRAHGCRVIGIDSNRHRLQLAQSFGAETVDISTGEDPEKTAAQLTRSHGVDAVIIAASTKSSDPVSQAARMCRKRGRIVLVGVTGLELSRSDFYEKELVFQVSCSYGPGRYDPNYEERGSDYPFGLVRWTEGRNFEAILQAIAERRLKLAPLISDRVPIAEATRAYELLHNNSASTTGIVLTYPAGGGAIPGKESRGETSVAVNSVPPRAEPGNSPAVAVVGAGTFATHVLLPNLRKSDCARKVIASRTGLNGYAAARRFDFERASTDVEAVFSDLEVNTVFVTTRHDSHASFAIQALRTGKHVFVEKPIAISRDELHEVSNCYRELTHHGRAPILCVGFNRRFAPFVVHIKSLLESVVEPLSIDVTVNAGELPAGHWLRDPAVGGGRLIGEACHFVDLVRFLADSPILAVSAVRAGSPPSDGSVCLTLTFASGSVGTVHYLTGGHRSFPKERVEIFGGGRVLSLDNFRTLRAYGWPAKARRKTRRQDKGHAAITAAFLSAVEHGQPSPVPFTEIAEVMEAVFDAVDQTGV